MLSKGTRVKSSPIPGSKKSAKSFLGMHEDALKVSYHVKRSLSR